MTSSLIIIIKANWLMYDSTAPGKARSGTEKPCTVLDLVQYSVVPRGLNLLALELERIPPAATVSIKNLDKFNTGTRNSYIGTKKVPYLRCTHALLSM